MMHLTNGRKSVIPQDFNLDNITTVGWRPLVARVSMIVLLLFGASQFSDAQVEFRDAASAKPTPQISPRNTNSGPVDKSAVKKQTRTIFENSTEQRPQLQKERLPTQTSPQDSEFVGRDFQKRNEILFQLPQQDGTVKKLDKDIKDVALGIDRAETMLRRLTVKEFFIDRSEYYEKNLKPGVKIDKTAYTHWSLADRKELVRRITGKRSQKIDDTVVTVVVRQFMKKFKLEVAGLVIQAGGLAALVGNNATQLIAGKALDKYLNYKLVDPVNPKDKSVGQKINNAFQNASYKDKKAFLQNLIKNLKVEKMKLESQKAGGTSRGADR